MRHSRLSTFCKLRGGLITLILTSSAGAQVNFQWATIGNPGNVADTRPMNKGPGIPADGSSGYGSVGYNYRIATTPVTNSQYVEFLNTVDPNGANTLALYNSSMSSIPAGVAYTGGIDRNLGAPAGNRYTVKAGQAAYPATWINWVSAARFVNWLANGQGSGSTESGVYDMTLSIPTRAANAAYFIPTENEFYKAAYYDPTKNGTGGYWEFGTRTETPPVSEAPSTGSNSSNYRGTDGNYWQDGGPTANPTINHLVDVGSYPNSRSYYGLLDVDGNVYNWTETFFAALGNNFPLYRGGGWFNDASRTGASHRNLYSFATATSYHFFGMRIAAAAAVSAAQWNTNGGGDWAGTSNWTPGVPNGAGVSATFGPVISSPSTVTLPGPHTVGELTFNSVNSYTIAGVGPLSFDSDAGNAMISVSAGTHVISTPVNLNDNLTVSSAAGTGVQLTNTLTAAGRSIAKLGAGSVQFENVRSAALNVDGGTARISVKPVGNDPSGTSIVQSLSVASGATLDLTNNALIVDYATLGTLLADVQQLAASNRITSSVAASNESIGYANNAVLNYSTFGGQAVDSSSILIRLTIDGDANLDGNTNISDFAALAASFNSTGFWQNGDFNHSGQVEIGDFSLLAANFNRSVDPMSRSATVPEPSVTLSILFGISRVAASGRYRRFTSNHASS